MDFNHNPVQNRPQPEPLIPVSAKKKRRPSFRLGKINTTGSALVLIAIVLIAFGLLWYFRGGFGESGYINKNEYQAIFLSNGQVYFGKLDTLTPQYAELTDIYYLQVNQTVQPSQSNDSSSQPQNVSLVKLGNELHGPEDAMQINRDQIVFWENLKKSGKVTQAIMNYQKNGSNASSTPATSTTSTPSSSSSTGTSEPSSNTTGTTGNTSTTSNTTSTTPGTTKP